MLISKFRKHQDEKAEIHFETARKGGLYAIYKLFNRYYLKSFFGPFFSFAFPVLIYAILGNVMDHRMMFGGIAAMSAMSTGLTGMPFAIIELRKSVLLKRIGASPVKPSKFTFVIISYFTVTIFLSVFWLMIWGLIIFQDTGMYETLNNTVSALAFFYGIILTIILSITVGFAIASVSKNEQQAQAIGMLLYFPSTFLSGQFISIETVAGSNVMNWISRILPFRYPTMLTVVGWNNSVFYNSLTLPDVFDPNALSNGQSLASLATGENANPFLNKEIYTLKFESSQYILANLGKITTNPLEFKPVQTALIYDSWEPILAYVYPWTITIGLGLFSAKVFRWSAAR